MSISLSFSLQKRNCVQGTKMMGTSERSREFRGIMSVLLLQRRNFFVFTHMYRYCTKVSSLKLISAWDSGPQSYARHSTTSHLRSDVPKTSDVGIMFKTERKVNALHINARCRTFASVQFSVMYETGVLFVRWAFHCQKQGPKCFVCACPMHL